MKRKLFSAVLGVFAMLLLMGAAAVPKDPASALLAEEESAVLSGTVLDTEAKSLNVQFAQGIAAAVGADSLGDAVGVGSGSMRDDDEASESSSSDTSVPVVTGDPSLLIDGQPTPVTLGKRMHGSTTYVSLGAMSQLLDPTVQITWDGKNVTVTTEALSINARVGQLYIEANGRYLYVPELVQVSEGGQISVPLRVVAEAFGASVGYDGATGVVTVTRGSGAIQPGDSFYNQDDLFWLSRVIFRESGNQPMEGQMAVGNVVLNRVADPIFPDTVEGVLAQKNQFSTYKSGVLAATEPSESSIIAAKLVMDGGEVEETKGALYFDSGATSWAARNKRHIATIGGHKFYG